MKIFERTRKKASLNLSINAIVVLILAITMLGLGLGFIRTMFKGATGKLSGAIESTSLKNPADVNTPLTIDRQIELKAKSPERIEIGYYNAYTKDNENVAVSLKGCDDPTITEALQIKTLPASKVPPGESTGYNAIIELTKAVGTGTYICQVEAKGTEEAATQAAQFFLEITG